MLRRRCRACRGQQGRVQRRAGPYHRRFESVRGPSRAPNRGPNSLPALPCRAAYPGIRQNGLCRRPTTTGTAPWEPCQAPALHVPQRGRVNHICIAYLSNASRCRLVVNGRERDRGDRDRAPEYGWIAKTHAACTRRQRSSGTVTLRLAHSVLVDKSCPPKPPRQSGCSFGYPSCMAADLGDDLIAPSTFRSA